MSKKIILVIIIVIVLSFIIYRVFIKEEKPAFTLEKVTRGQVVKEISETGTVKISEEANLSFKNSGRIEKIYVEVGNIVTAGQDLAKLDTTELSIQLTEAQAALEVAQANYDKLLAGATAEEIKVVETEVLDAQIVLENAQQNLEDVEDDAEEDLDQAYEDALNTLDDAYLKIYNAYNKVDFIRRTYIVPNSEGLIIINKKSSIKGSLDRVEDYINTAKTNSQEDMEEALSGIADELESVADALTVIRENAESMAYRDIIPSSERDYLDTHRLNINTAHSNIIGAEQTISTTKINNETNINTAEAEVSTAQARLQKAQDELNLLTAGPRQEDISLYQAKIKQAQAQVSLLQNQIQEATLKSPTNGQITEINKREGEVVQSAETVISFLPSAPFQVKVDIYEEDIVDVKVGNAVNINLVPFPDETLKGRVASIDPAEKLIEGVVYYEVTIGFEETKEGIRLGMTADIIIEAAKKENVLIIPKGAVKKINGKKIVQVSKEGEIKEREIEVGLEGNEFFEVISGLEEGEEIIIE